MIIPNIWENKKWSKPPTRIRVIWITLGPLDGCKDGWASYIYIYVYHGNYCGANLHLHDPLPLVN